jgi:hypothetical protein
VGWKGRSMDLLLESQQKGGETVETGDNRGPACIVYGSVSGGFKVKGPFDSIATALKWIEETNFELVAGMCSVQLLESTAPPAPSRFDKEKHLAGIKVCCERCREEKDLPRVRMITCPCCGNKRCPKAEWHQFQCTGSNASGQVGVEENWHDCIDGTRKPYPLVYCGRCLVHSTSP